MAALLGLLLATALPARAWDPEEFGEMGLAIKAGECAGPMGAQLSWNFSSHWQLAAGVGGANPLASLLEQARIRTDSYYVLGKYYFKHLFLAAGYTYSHSLVRVESESRFQEDRGSEHGLPVHLGYEFGKRKGFYFSTSIGFLFVPGGGGRALEVSLPETEAKYRTTDSGPSVGATLGYYFDFFD